MAEYPLPKFHFQVQWGGTKIVWPACWAICAAVSPRPNCAPCSTASPNCPTSPAACLVLLQVMGIV